MGSRDSSVRMFLASSVKMLPHRFQNRSVARFHDSSARMFLASSVTMSPDRFQGRSVTTFPGSSASRCPSRSVTPPSQPTESKEENIFLNTLSLSPTAPSTPFQTSVDLENILVSSIFCHFQHVTLSTIFMSALFKYNMRHSEIYKEIVF